MRAGLALGLVIWALSGISFSAEKLMISGEFTPLDHPARHLAFWKSLKLRSVLENKIIRAPSVLIDYLCKDNLVQGFSNIPKPADLAPDYKADLVAALKDLPESVKKVVGPNLYGIAVVSDLGGSAYTDTVLSETKEPLGAFMVLDLSMLNRQANEWLSWKENSPFLPDSKTQLVAEIETASSDTRKNALQFILLHEFGHVIAATVDLHPSWNKTHDSPGKHPFSALSWKLYEKSAGYVSIFDHHFGLRRYVTYYRGAETKIEISHAPQIYGALEKTNFATLYAATSPADDFAESFATYVHTVLMKRPYLIKIRSGGHLIKSFSPCWGQKRCETKQKIIERLLGVSKKSHFAPQCFRNRSRCGRQ